MKNVSLRPNVVVYDSNHDRRNTNKMNGDKYKVSDLFTGNNLWINASVIILRGTNISSNYVIATRTVVREEIRPNSIIYNKKELYFKEYFQE